jgi:hypothetical protein
MNEFIKIPVCYGKGGKVVSSNQSFPVAELSQYELDEIKQFEEHLRKATGEEIVLIAYEQKSTTDK